MSDPDRWANMKYHDWHLKGYSVRDNGTRVVLHLAWDYPNQEMKENHIVFSDVVAYHFIHGMGAIITEIDEEPLVAFAQNEESFIRTTNAQVGLREFNEDVGEYLGFLSREGYRYWTISSAIGFAGFVVAKSIEETTEPNQRLFLR